MLLYLVGKCSLYLVVYFNVCTLQPVYILKLYSVTNGHITFRKCP